MIEKISFCASGHRKMHFVENNKCKIIFAVAQNKIRNESPNVLFFLALYACVKLNLLGYINNNTTDYEGSMNFSKCTGLGIYILLTLVCIYNVVGLRPSYVFFLTIR